MAKNANALLTVDAPAVSSTAPVKRSVVPVVSSTPVKTAYPAVSSLKHDCRGPVVIVHGRVPTGSYIAFASDDEFDNIPLTSKVKKRRTLGQELRAKKRKIDENGKCKVKRKRRIRREAAPVTSPNLEEKISDIPHCDSMGEKNTEMSDDFIEEKNDPETCPIVNAQVDPVPGNDDDSAPEIVSSNKNPPRKKQMDAKSREPSKSIRISFSDTESDAAPSPTPAVSDITEVAERKPLLSQLISAESISPPIPAPCPSDCTPTDPKPKPFTRTDPKRRKLGKLKRKRLKSPRLKVPEEEGGATWLYSSLPLGSAPVSSW